MPGPSLSLIRTRLPWIIVTLMLATNCSRESASTQAAEEHRAFIVSIFGDLAELEQLRSARRVELNIAAIPMPPDAAQGANDHADTVWQYRYEAVYAPNGDHGAAAVFDELIERIEAEAPARSAWLTPSATVYCAVFDRPDGVSGSLLRPMRSSRELRDRQRADRASGATTGDSGVNGDLVAIEFFDQGPCHRDDLVPYDS